MTNAARERDHRTAPTSHGAWRPGHERTVRRPGKGVLPATLAAAWRRLGIRPEPSFLAGIATLAAIVLLHPPAPPQQPLWLLIAVAVMLATRAARAGRWPIGVAAALLLSCAGLLIDAATPDAEPWTLFAVGSGIALGLLSPRRIAGIASQDARPVPDVPRCAGRRPRRAPRIVAVQRCQSENARCPPAPRTHRRYGRARAARLVFH